MSEPLGLPSKELAPKQPTSKEQAPKQPEKTRAPLFPAMLKKSAARLAAVQALYGADITESSKAPAALALELIAAYQDKEISCPTEEGESQRIIAPDEKLLAALITGVCGNKEMLDAEITPHLADGGAFEKVAPLMRAILRAAVYELGCAVKAPAKVVPAKVVINEYVAVARCFHSDAEINFVNGILDKIARKLRPEELR